MYRGCHIDKTMVNKVKAARLLTTQGKQLLNFLRADLEHIHAMLAVDG